VAHMSFNLRGKTAIAGVGLRQYKRATGSQVPHCYRKAWS